MDGEEVGRRGIPSLLKPSSSSADGGAGPPPSLPLLVVVN